MSKVEYYKISNLLQNSCDCQLLKEGLNTLIDKTSENTLYKDFLDNILLLINNLVICNEIDDKMYRELLLLMNYFYQEENNYSLNRVEWLQELRKDYPTKSMSEHHLNVLSYFDLINCVLNSRNIDYFHSSGFMGYIILNRPLQRYHHDIDLFVNINDINKIQDIFSMYDFHFEYTYEKTKDGNYRYGCKINNSIIDIPIWLSFYRRNADGSMYVEEYYETIDKKPFTKRNYNSPDCSILSLTDGIHNGIPYHSISLDALYISKDTKRKKDLFDRKIIENSIDEVKIKRIIDGLSFEWEVVDGIPDDIKKLSEVARENKNGIMFTKKRI